MFPVEESQGAERGAGAGPIAGLTGSAPKLEVIRLGAWLKKISPICLHLIEAVLTANKQRSLPKVRQLSMA